METIKKIADAFASRKSLLNFRSALASENFQREYLLFKLYTTVSQIIFILYK